MGCSAACGYTEVVAGCATSHLVDVTFLIDRTGSNASSATTFRTQMLTECIAPLLALRDVFVGISYSGDFPIDPYGTVGDVPFEGGIETTTSMPAIAAEWDSMPTYSGGDGSEGTLEALAAMVGAPVTTYSRPLTCSSGRTGVGCLQRASDRFVVVFSGAAMHGGPGDGGTLFEPYMSISPAPSTWPEVRPLFVSSRTTLLFINTESTQPQFAQILGDIGQPLTDIHPATDRLSVTDACAAIVERVRRVAVL